MEVVKIDKKYLPEIEISEKKYFYDEAYNLRTLKEITKDIFNIYQFKILVDNEILVGYIIYKTVDIIEIYKIFVKEEFRNKRLSYILLNDCIEYATEKKINRILLEVRKNNISALNLYKKCDFKEINIRKNYYHNPVCDCIVMEKKINL